MKRILYYFILFNSLILSEILPQQITVTSPNGGENWQAGTTNQITWTDNIAENVSIDLIGTDLVSNGTFDVDSAWTKYGATTISDGVAHCNTSGSGLVLLQPSTPIPNAIYYYSFEITNYSSGNIALYSGTFSGYKYSNGIYSGIVNWTGNSFNLQFFSTIGFVGDIDNIIVRKITPITGSTASDGTYNWDIPIDVLPGSDYKVKITSLGDPNLFDYSDNNFTIFPKEITVTSPNGGESWQAGTTHQINWTDNFTDQVMIDLYKSSVFHSNITPSTASDGTYGWDIPYDLPDGSDYKIKITNVSHANVSDLSDNNFTIFPKTINVTSPNNGENWPLGSTQSITWTDNFSERVKIDLYKADTLYYTIDPSTPSDGLKNWDIPGALPADTDYKIKITSTGNENIFDFSDADFSLVYDITVTSPNGGESWQAGTNQSITWFDNIIDDVKIDLYKGGTFHSSITASTISDGSYSWDIQYDLPDGSDYKVKITSLADPNLSDYSDNNFTIVANQITVLIPNGGEIFQANTTQQIIWTDNFTDQVMIDLYKGGTFHSPITASTASDGTYNWIIDYDLPDGSDYKVKITSLGDPDVYDFSDNNFTIIANQVTVTSPNGGENWPIGSTQTITYTDNFSENVKIDLYKGGLYHSIITPSSASDGNYDWNILATLPEGSDYKIKITSIGSNNVFDFSDANFTLSYNITVTSPNGGESFQAGTTQPVTWTDNFIEDVKIDLYKTGTFHSSITASTASDGNYSWSIPYDLQDGSDYKVKITSLGDPNLFDYSDNNFTIIANQVTVLSPNGGEFFQAGTIQPIIWTDNFTDQVMIDLYKGGVFHSNITPSTASDGTYNWNIPFDLEDGSDYKVKITSLGDPDVFDFSDNDFTIVANELTVTSPNGGENWPLGSTQTITWIDNFPENVKIELYKGGSLFFTIVSATPSDGERDWDIPASLAADTDYKIKITSLGDPDIFDFSDADFSLTNDITVISPNGGESFQAGSTQPITWTDNILDNVKIDLYKGGTFHSPIIASTPSDGTYNWDIQYDLPDGSDYKVKITSLGDPNLFDYSDSNFTIIANQITVIIPNGGEFFQAGTIQQIIWTDNFTDQVMIDLYKGGVFHSNITPSTASDGTYNWNIPFDLEDGSDYKVKITSLGDPDVFDFSDNDFTIVANELTVTSPNGGENWPLGTTQTITWIDNFPENVKIELYKAGSLYSLIDGSTPSDGEKNWAIPAAFPEGSDYKIKITSLGDTSIYDFSDADFALSFSITVTSPNGGESFQAGTTQPITWTDNISDDVKIDLYKSGNLHSSIIASTPSDGTYNWVIPYEFEDGSEYKVKITSLGDPNLFDYSDSNFTIIANQVTVISPNGGENWPIGSTQTITWSDNFSENVKIELFKGGALSITITPSTPSDGERIWAIPASLPEGSDYRIKITSTGSDNVFDFSDADFTLSYNITVTSPNGGENWQVGTSHTITWTDNITGPVKIDLYKAEVFDSTITSSTASDGSYEWDISPDLQVGSDYKVLITSLEDTTLFDYSDDNFTLFLVPEITVISPNGGEAWQTGTTQTITWTDNLSENVRIRLYFFGNFITVENSVPSSGSYVWDIPLNFPPNDFYKVWINSVNDTTIEDFSDGEFSIVTTAISITSPNGGENWKAGTQEQITWTDNISDAVMIELYKGGVFDSTIKDTTASDGTYNWNIPYDLNDGTDYRVKITSHGDPEVFDFSNNNFTITGNQVTVTSPNGGESWKAGTTETITWDDNFPDNVKIELYKGGIVHTLIVNSTTSDGERDWNIPYDFEGGSNYKVKITSLGDTSIFDLSDDNFTIISNHVTVTTPNGGENWLLSTTQSITWSDNFAENVKIELYKGGTLHSLIINSTSSDGQRDWNIPASLPEGSDYQIKITSRGNENIFDLSDSVFSLSNEIAVVSPNGGEFWQINTTKNITWVDNLSAAIKIELYKNGTSYLEISASTPNDGSKPWDIPSDLPISSDYKIKITSIDIADFFDFSDADFTINNIVGVEDITNKIPDEYSLFQNYPNPFNPSTRIEFGLMEHSSVSLRLYDILGQEVAVVIDNESLPAGMFRYNFIASNLPSGIYIYYLAVKSNVSDKTFNQPKKMILLK